MLKEDEIIDLPLNAWAHEGLSLEFFHLIEEKNEISLGDISCHYSRIFKTCEEYAWPIF